MIMMPYGRPWPRRSSQARQTSGTPQGSARQRLPDLSYAGLQAERRKLPVSHSRLRDRDPGGGGFPALAIVFCFGIGVCLIVPFGEVVQLLFPIFVTA
jgi:hypothetical protein